MGYVVLLRNLCLARQGSTVVKTFWQAEQLSCISTWYSGVVAHLFQENRMVPLDLNNTNVR